MPVLEMKNGKELEPNRQNIKETMHNLEKEESYFGMVLNRFMKHKLAVIGLITILLIALVAVFAPYIAPKNPYEIHASFGAAPSAEHWLGTDLIGRDVFSRLIYASRVSLLVGIGSVFVYTVIGTILGTISGYFGGWVDMLFMRITDVFMSFTKLIVILVVVSIFGPSLFNIILILGLLGWPSVARLVRGSVLSLKEIDFVKSAVVLGISTPRIVFSHILPNTIAPLLVHATFGIAAAIIIEASLSYLGMGVQPPIASWGNMLTDAQSISVISSQPWLWIPPGIMIVIAVLSINFVGDGLRDALDPKMID